jgi:hypothetical protein
MQRTIGELEEQRTRDPKGLTPAELQSLIKTRAMLPTAKPKAPRKPRQAVPIHPEPTPAGNVTALPKYESPQRLARDFMENKIGRDRYAKGNGIYRLMRMAADSDSEIASIRALEALTKLARLDEPDAQAEDTEVMLCEIGVRENKIVKLDAPAAETAGAEAAPEK